VKPLAGCRVLDLGIITAGAATSALLADLGAEVIKVESPTYRDPFRVWAGEGEPEEGDDLPVHFRATNRNKQAISIDLKRPEGRAVIMRLVTKADVVVENFRRGVLAKLGLSFEELKTANRAIVLASVSSQGETGPDASHVSYGTTLEAVSGLAWGTGYAGGRPEVSGRDVNYPDQVVAIFAAGMISAALRTVRSGGDGVHLDLSQRDLTSFLYGEAFAAASLGEARPRAGNADPAVPLQDCFRAADGRWLAITVEPDAFAGVAAALGAEAGAPPAEIARRLATLVAGRTAGEARAFVVSLGAKVAIVADGLAMIASEGKLWSHALARVDGAIVKGFPFQLDEAPMRVVSDAPHVGADTRAVLARLGGYDEGEIAALAEAGVIELGR